MKRPQIGLTISKDMFSGELTGLEKIFSDYFIHQWASENLNVAGSTTTAIDYSGTHDLANPAASNQPSLNASDSDFNNLPSLSFTTDDYLYKAVSDWRIGDSSGVFTMVFKKITGSNMMPITTGDEGASSSYYNTALSSKFRTIIAGNTIVGTATNFGANDINVVSFSSDGSNYYIHINGVLDTISSGTNNGNWLDMTLNRDNIAIGGVIISTPLYANINWVFSAYGAYVSGANIIDSHTDLMSYYDLP